MTAPRPRILVVEDEPGIADTIRYALATDGFEPVCVGTGAEALALLGVPGADGSTNDPSRGPGPSAGTADAGRAAGPIALVILDVGLPDVNGFELFKRIHAASAVPVVFLTARSDEIDRVVGLELGADDYVAKPFSPRELVARVRTILRRAARGAAAGNESGGTAAVAPTHAAGSFPGVAGPGGAAPPGAPGTAAPLHVDVERRRITYYGRALELSRYEFGLLSTLAARPGRVWTREELLAQVWGADSDSFDRTVDAHVKTVRAKLKAVAPEVEPIVTHRGTGYALSDALPAIADVRLAPTTR